MCTYHTHHLGPCLSATDCYEIRSRLRRHIQTIEDNKDKCFVVYLAISDMYVGLGFKANADDVPDDIRNRRHSFYSYPAGVLLDPN